MTTATPTKVELDPDFEDGILLTAEELLPSDPRRLDLALRVSETWGRLRQTDDRINAAVERIEELQTIVNQASGKELDQALKERRELSAELAHAPEDVAATSEQFAAALGPWAKTARNSARAIIVEVRTATADRQDQRRRLHEKLDVSLSKSQQPTPDERERLKERLRTLNESLVEEFKRGSAAEDLASGAAGVVTRRFGDSTAEVLVNPGGVRRWIEGRRRSISQRTGAHTGIRDALRPLSNS